MKALLFLMTAGILASCSKQDQIQDLEQTDIMSKPVYDTVKVTSNDVNNNGYYYSYSISFDKPLQHKASVRLKWYTMVNGEVFYHDYVFTTTKDQVQDNLTNVPVEWKWPGFGQILHTTVGPLDSIWAVNTVFIR